MQIPPVPPGSGSDADAIRAANIATADANAALIAAAPDLLEALRECVTDEGAHVYQDGRNILAIARRFDEINRVARAAIAKATQP